jgi:CRP-like cAMP-binding protein
VALDSANPMVPDFAARAAMHPTEMLTRRLRADTSLSEDDLKVIKALPIDLQEVEADSPIVSEGDRPSHCCLMVTGFSIRSKVASAGRRQILSFHIPGDIPDLQSLFLGKWTTILERSPRKR